MKRLLFFLCFFFSFSVFAQNDTSVWNHVFAGYKTSFGIKSDGSLWGWGTGPLGQGDSLNKQQLPLQIGADKWTTIAAGSFHTLGIKEDSSLWGWGKNTYGNVGDSTLIYRTYPVHIGNDKWTAVAAGEHSLGIKADSSLWGWGYNKYGSVGDSTTINKIVPTPVLPGTKWLAVSAGLYHSVGLRSDSTLWLWGFADWELRQTPFTIKSPSQIGSDTWMHIVAGGYHTLLLKSDSTLWGWGSNVSGAMGNGTTQVVYRPAQISTDKWINVTAGMHFSAGVKKDGSLWAWGDNHYGMLGDLTRASIYVPVKIEGVNWKKISGGMMHTLGLKAGQRGYCATGDNGYGQLGTGKFGPTQQYICQLPQLTVTETNQALENTEGISIYPNPSNGDVTMSFAITGKYSIVDHVGHTVESFEVDREATDFHLQHLPNGIYFIVCNAMAQPLRKKLVVIK